MESNICIMLSLIIIAILIYDVICILRLKKKESLKIKFMNKKILAEIVFVFSIVLFLIYLEFSFVGINLKGQAAFRFKLCWLIADMILGIISSTLFAWEIEITNDGIVYNRLFKKKIIRYNDIVSFRYMKNGNIQLQLVDSGKISISEITQMINKVSIVEYLSKRNIVCISEGILDMFVMCWPIGYMIFFLVLSVCSVLFVITYIYYELILGIIIFGVCGVFFIIYSSVAIANKMIVCRDKIIVSSFHKKKTYYLDDIKFVRWSESGTAKYLNVYFRNDQLIKINSVWTNFDMFKKKIYAMNIKWKK